MGSNSIFELTLSKPHSFFIMTTRTITGRSTRNSRNAGSVPAAFQHFMNDIFADMVNVCVIIYLNDILVYSDNIDQHRTHVREVLRRLRENGLYTGAHNVPSTKTRW